MTIEPILGLEIHVQLKTKSKMFCGCNAQYFGDEPNTHMCPVCLALPGALPKANKKALENAIKVGVALHCEINKFSRFDRKNYMYPDLFKGYQITQYESPICGNGYVDIEIDGKTKRIGVTRAHQEEDTAKSIHESTYTLIDGNKAGVPLLEIVSEPDMSSDLEAKAYAEYVYNTLRFVGVSDCDMEKGQMRFDVNVNVKISKENENGEAETVATPIVEIKNLNSFRSLQRSIQYEIERQTSEYKKTGVTIAKGNKTTRGWSDDRDETYPLRSKEEAEDYRYFPDPDLPPVEFTDEEIEKLRSEVGKLPTQIYEELVESGMHPEMAKFFVTDRKLYDYLISASSSKEELLSIGNWIKGPVMQILLEREDFRSKSIEEIIPAKRLVDLIRRVEDGTISSTAGKDVLEYVINQNAQVDEAIEVKGLKQISDEDVLLKSVKNAIDANASAVDNYIAGKQGSLMFIVGQVMRELKGKGNPAMIKTLVEGELEKIKLERSK